MEFRMLGTLDVLSGGVALPLGPAKQRTLLAALLADAGQPVPVETLIERVWGDSAPGRARDLVYPHVSRLRTILVAPTDGRDGGALVERCAGGYRLDVDRNRVDAHRLRDLLIRGRAEEADSERRSVLLGQALALWRGVPLADLHGDWVQRIRQELEQQLETAAVLWARTEAELGRAQLAVEELQQRVRERPLSEPLVAELMRSLALTGRSPDALRVYTVTRHRTRQELGVEPGERVRALYASILRGDLRPSRQEVPVGGTRSPLDPADPLPLPRRPRQATSTRSPAQLPAAVDRFTGRAVEVDRLDQVLTPEHAGATSLVTITGPPRIGKTALALHWAHRVRRCFPEGQLYADLGGQRGDRALDPAVVLTRFVHALGLRSRAIGADVDELAGLYRTLLDGRRVLVVLDDARDAAQVRPLVPGWAGCGVVCTSRDELLALTVQQGALLLELDALAGHDCRVLLTRLLGEDRVRSELSAAAELARLCGYLPLPLRLAGTDLARHPDDSIASYVAWFRARGAGPSLGVDAGLDQPHLARHATGHTS